MAVHSVFKLQPDQGTYCRLPHPLKRVVLISIICLSLAIQFVLCNSIDAVKYNEGKFAANVKIFNPFMPSVPSQGHWQTM